jgi:hypothetical protein
VTSRRTELLMWIGLFGAPVAWVASHAVGWAVSEAHCEAVQHAWGIGYLTWESVILVLSLLLALVGLIASILTYRSVKGVDKDAPGPEGRLWLLSISGIVTSSLLLVAIVLTHTATLALNNCNHP